MNRTTLSTWLAVLVAVVVTQFAPTAIAQTGAAYPTKAIRMLVAFPPGGPTDIVARVIAQKLSEQLGQPVLVENKPGAGGNIGAETAMRAAPDGYTLFYNTSAITIAPALYSKVNFDPVKDFAPISSTAAVPMVLMVTPSLAVKSVKELLDYAKANPDKLNYGSTGSGTITHLATAALAAHAGLRMQHIPYKGSAPNIADLASGATQLTIDTLNSSMPFIRDNRVRPLAVTTLKRSPLLPELPTLDETALPGMEMSAWQGIVVPTGTPPAIIARLNAEVRKALENADVKAKLAAQGTDILGSTPEQYGAYIRSELGRWSKLVKETGAKAD
jgi:tripartite-type tricarboxylate transporter receptor subunit TctC